MRRHTTLSSWVLLLVSILMLSACGGGGGSDSSSDNNTNKTQKGLFDTIADTLMTPIGIQASPTDCSAIGFSQYEGAPGDVITVTGIPNSFEEPFFRSLAELDSKLKPIPTPMPVFPTDTAGQYTFAVPPYMLDPMMGGQVSLELSDSEAKLHCPGITFDIKALPKKITTASAARDSLNQLQGSLEDWVDSALVHIGRKPAKLLAANVDTLSKPDQLLWLSKRYVSSNDAGALSSLLSQLTDEEAIFLANLFEATQTQQLLTDATTALPTTPPDLIPVTSPSSTPTGFSTLPVAISVPHISCEAATITKFKYNITSIEELSAHMKARSLGIPFNISDLGQLLKAFTWQQEIGIHVLGMLLKNQTTGSSLFNKISQTRAGLDKIGKRLKLAGDVAFIAARIRQASLAMEPHEISAFSLADVEDTWIENRPPTDTMTWGSAKISAVGEDYNLYRVLLDSGRKFLGRELAKYLGGKNAALAYNAVVQLTSSYVNEKFKELSKNQCLRLKAPTYGPITFTDPTAKWTKTRVRNGSQNVEVIDDKNYKGIRIGKALLEVIPRAEEFPSESGINLSSFINVLVTEVIVTADPVYRTVNSTPQTFSNISATAIAYGKNTAAHISATADKGTIDAKNPTDSTLKLTYTTPANLSELPALITYMWDGRKLPNGHDSMRTATTKFDKKGHITLSPSNATCLTPGEQLTITATIEGFPSADAIAWTGSSLSDGSSKLEKIFTANALGTYTITAFSIADASVFDETKITVSDSCIAKAWNPFVHYELDGNGTYGDGPNCPPNSEPDNISHEVSNDSFPVPPAQGIPWIDKSETYGWSNLHSSTRYYSTIDACFSEKFVGRNNSSTTYSAKSDGTLEMSVNIDMAGDIKTIGTSTSNSTPQVDASFASAMFGYYYIPIKTDTTLHLEGAITCHNVNSNQIRLTTKASVMIIPYDEADQPLMGWKPSDVSAADFPFILKGISCQANEMNFFDKTITVGTYNGIRPSKVVLFVSGGLLGMPYPVDLSAPAPLANGFYEAMGTVDFSIRVSKQ